MEDKRREILTQVAEGKLSPQEAAAMLDQAGEAPASEASAAVQPVSTGVAVGVPIRKIRVSNALGRTAITGDPSIAGGTADGQHTARQEGDTLVIEGEPADDGFVFIGPIRVGSRSFGRTLNVRVNPDLELWVQAQAGSVVVRGVRGPIHAKTEAGSTVIEGSEGPLDITAELGSVRAEGRLVGGESRIRCEMGSVRLALSKDSSVRVKARSSMGSVRIDGGVRGGKPDFLGQTRETVIGDGQGTLDIEASMGSVRVVVEG